MVKIELWCGVYGEGSVFSVDIERNAKVADLQKAIARILSTNQNTIPPRLVTLYLARKNGGAWLKDDDNVKGFLRGDVDKQYKEMRSSWTLDDKEYFGDQFQPRGKEIHILVELPEAAVDVAGIKSLTAKLENKMEEMDVQNKRIEEMHEQLVQKKRKRYTHSRMSSNKGAALLQTLKIQVKAVCSAPGATENPTPVDVFTWESVCDERGQSIVLTEEQQRERYRTYVETNIGDVLAKKHLCVFGVERGASILTTPIPGHEIDLVGRTDMLILNDLIKQSPANLMLFPDVKMLIEVKKNVESGSVFQALSELIALDILAADPVMALLTDLTGHWQFFWVSEKSDNHAIIQTMVLKDPSAAFAVIRTLLECAPTSSDAEFSLPYVEEPVKRRKLAELLPAIGEDGEGGGIRAALERYYDIASILGPDIAMAREAASQIVRTIPAFSYYT